ncbi:serine hydrolase [Marinimicrobium sp. LS-A18]|uniref:serine hydrolase domain-containing protein n=1 Tax=Marinimicrobium sp. LS-A18 TaxID=1381596 RepID=UPI00046689C3|nr:serine hydrolase domain-containing protein [Marinimicrobium sp. LS-A18]
MKKSPMSIKKSFLGLVGVTVLGGALLACSSTTSNPVGDSYQGLAEDIHQAVDKRLAPGAITTIYEKGSVVFHDVYGYEDLDSAKQLHDDSLFRLYSMSKPITSVAIMMLVDQGRLALEDPIEQFLVEFKDAEAYASGPLGAIKTEPLQRSITIADLLTHTSGITYHFSGDTPVHQYYRKYGVKRATPVGSNPDDGAPADSLKELTHRIAQAPLLHQPGERFSYSYSTTVLGRVIEQVTGESLDRALKRMVLEPLEMNDTGFYVEGDDLDRFVTNYLMTDEGLVAIENRDNTDYKDRSRLLDGGGALAGTAQDYLNFSMMLMNKGRYKDHQLLSPEMIERMFTPAVEIPGADSDASVWFGLGFAIGTEETERAGNMPNGSFGWAGSGNTFFWVEPESQRAVVFMTHVIAPPDQIPFRGLIIDALGDRTPSRGL